MATVLEVRSRGARGVRVAVGFEVILWGASVLRVVVVREVSSGALWVPRTLECLVAGITGG